MSPPSPCSLGGVVGDVGARHPTTSGSTPAALPPKQPTPVQVAVYSTLLPTTLQTPAAEASPLLTPLLTAYLAAMGALPVVAGSLKQVRAPLDCEWAWQGRTHNGHRGRSTPCCCAAATRGDLWESLRCCMCCFWGTCASTCTSKQRVLLGGRTSWEFTDITLVSERPRIPPGGYLKQNALSHADRSTDNGTAPRLACTSPNRFWTAANAVHER